jgi:DegV family protein with EDD domain
MTRIVTDTTSGLSLEEAKARGIYLLPQIVIFGKETYRDDTELDTAAFMEKLHAASELPKTAAPPPALYRPIYEEISQAGEEALCIHPSTNLSGTVRSATVAANDFPDAAITILDTRTIAGNLATLVLLAKEWADEGANAEEIRSRLQEMIPRQRMYFLVDTLKYLQMGGRIGKASALAGELLKIKPILTLEDGIVAPYERERTRKRALRRLREIIEAEAPRGEEGHLCVMHAAAENEARALAESLQESLDIPHIPLYTLPPAIIVHAGPGALAVGFFTN